MIHNFAARLRLTHFAPFNFEIIYIFKHNQNYNFIRSLLFKFSADVLFAFTQVNVCIGVKYRRVINKRVQIFKVKIKVKIKIRSFI